MSFKSVIPCESLNNAEKLTIHFVNFGTFTRSLCRPSDVVYFTKHRVIDCVWAMIKRPLMYSLHQSLYVKMRLACSSRYCIVKYRIGKIFNWNERSWVTCTKQQGQRVQEQPRREKCRKQTRIVFSKYIGQFLDKWTTGATLQQFLVHFWFLGKDEEPSLRASSRPCRLGVCRLHSRWHGLPSARWGQDLGDPGGWLGEVLQLQAPGWHVPRLSGKP